jgi:hypothetical protein
MIAGKARDEREMKIRLLSASSLPISVSVTDDLANEVRSVTESRNGGGL